MITIIIITALASFFQDCYTYEKLRKMKKKWNIVNQYATFHSFMRGILPFRIRYRRPDSVLQ